MKDLLTDDDEMNKSDEPTLPCRLDQVDVYISRVANLEKDPSLYREDDSDSTFHPQSTATLPSISFNPKVIPNHRAPTPTVEETITIDLNEDHHHENISKISDTES